MKWIFSFIYIWACLKRKKKVTIWDFQSSNPVHFEIYKGPDTFNMKLNKHFKSMISRRHLTSASRESDFKKEREILWPHLRITEVRHLSAN